MPTADLKSTRIIPLINEVAAMPQSPEQRTTLTFLRVERVAARVNSLPESDRQVYIQEMLRNRGVETADPYDRIEMLFMLCKYLQNNILSEQLSLIPRRTWRPSPRATLPEQTA